MLIQVQQGEGGKPCIGGKLNFTFLGVSLACLFDNWGNAIVNNRFADNGSYGHATNGDIAAFNFLDGNPTNCYSGNTDPAGLTTSPTGLEQTQPKCTGAGVPANANVPLVSGDPVRQRGVARRGEHPMPGWKALPESDARRHAPAAQASTDDASPLRGRAGQPVVPGAYLR